MKVKSENLKDLLISEAEAVGEAVRRAVRHALLTHERAGNLIASWKDGRVVWIPPDEIKVDDIEDERTTSKAARPRSEGDGKFVLEVEDGD